VHFLEQRHDLRRRSLRRTAYGSRGGWRTARTGIQADSWWRRPMRCPQRPCRRPVGPPGAARAGNPGCWSR
jgi:hypothetical protein